MNKFTLKDGTEILAFTRIAKWTSQAGMTDYFVPGALPHTISGVTQKKGRDPMPGTFAIGNIQWAGQWEEVENAISPLCPPGFIPAIDAPIFIVEFPVNLIGEYFRPHPYAPNTQPFLIRECCREPYLIVQRRLDHKGFPEGILELSLANHQRENFTLHIVRRGYPGAFIGQYHDSLLETVEMIVGEQRLR